MMDRELRARLRAVLEDFQATAYVAQALTP